ncbi:MAG: site-2 protease family protein [Candidatus Marsarchaeota archaeon]|nr:site-2 protease family protein [Candidatus Marsarchaeota archaeon]
MVMADGSIKIGSIFGIDIELNWLFILLILFFIYLSPLLGLIWILLFVCVLVHELSHSVTALRNGIKVSKIILLPIGGASIIDDLNIDPAVELNIAIAGPIMSMFLGSMFGILVAVTPPGLITYIVQYLFLINILLGLFNLIPAFPMDGGRVLRSYLQRRSGFYEATMKTVKISKYFLWLIVIGTLVFVAVPSRYSLGYKELTLLWDMIIVFFIYSGMKAEENAVTLRENAKGITVADALSHDYALMDYNADISELYNTIRRKKEHLVLIKIPNRGFAAINLFDKQAISKARKLKDIAVQIPNLPPSMNIVDVLSKTEGNAFRIAAIVKGSRLMGIATGSHLAALITLHVARKPKRKAFK